MSERRESNGNQSIPTYFVLLFVVLRPKFSKHPKKNLQ